MDALREQLSSFRSIEKQLTLNRVSALETTPIATIRLPAAGTNRFGRLVFFTGALTARNVRKVGNSSLKLPLPAAT